MKSTFTPNEKMLHNYIQNKLSPEETEQLELWLADHPEVMDELELDIMIKQAGDLPEPSENNHHNTPWWSWLTSIKLVPLHLAAYAMTALFVINTFNKNDGLQSSPATFIELEKVRGAETDAIKVDIQNKKSLVLRFFPDSMTDKYQVIIQSQDTNEKLEFNDLIADNLGSITISINNSDILTGHWSFEVYDNQLNKEQDFLIFLKQN